MPLTPVDLTQVRTYPLAERKNLVRLADQLDRLQRARAAAPELRERIATETREIFAPLV